MLRTVTVSKRLFEAGPPVAPEPVNKALPFSRDSRPAQLSGVMSSRRWGHSLLSEGQGMGMNSSINPLLLSSTTEGAWFRAAFHQLQ